MGYAMTLNGTTICGIIGSANHRLSDRSIAVPPTAIRGGWKVDDEGHVVGDFIPNPNFRPAPAE